jgi:hypothetical protein
MNILVYSFRSCTFLPILAEEFGTLFVFGKLKSDLQDFKQIVKSSNPKIVIGFANSHNDQSYIEPIAINQFNRTKRVIREGRDQLLLHVPPHLPPNVTLSAKPSDSFCNWAMFHICHLAGDNQYVQMFFHASPNHVQGISRWIKSRATASSFGLDDPCGSVGRSLVF